MIKVHLHIIVWELFTDPPQVGHHGSLLNGSVHLERILLSFLQNYSWWWWLWWQWWWCWWQWLSPPRPCPPWGNIWTSGKKYVGHNDGVVEDGEDGKDGGDDKKKITWNPCKRNLEIMMVTGQVMMMVMVRMIKQDHLESLQKEPWSFNLVSFELHVKAKWRLLGFD